MNSLRSALTPVLAGLPEAYMHAKGATEGLVSVPPTPRYTLSRIGTKHRAGHTMYEASIRIPMLAHCPDLFEANQRVQRMALNIDIAPTMLDAAGLAPSPAMHGRSLLPLLSGTTEWRKDFLYEYFWERAYPQTPSILGLRTDNYSYMNYHGIWDRDELYDIQSDPEQNNNLLADAMMMNQGGPVTAQIRQPGTRALVRDFKPGSNR